MKKILLIGAALAMFAGSVVQAADKPLSVHFFGYGGYWLGGKWLQNEEYFGDGALYGGRLGFAFSDRFALEAGVEFSPNEFPGSDIVDEGDVDITSYYGNFLAHFTDNRKICPYFIIGGGVMELDSDIDPPDTDPLALIWGLGAKYHFIENVAVRGEARQVIIKDSSDNILFTAGIELRFLGRWGKKEKPERVGWVSDSDGDGVIDEKDKCRATPPGVDVDSDGCPMDSDGDGVYDGLDQCPGTPRGAEVESNGCTDDSDGDGVVNGVDQCPGTPRGATVDPKGCPSDSDNDGVYDGIDTCPGTPVGAKVDAAGCPLDGDKDGVYDGLDDCPNTLEGLKVDSRGCTMDADGDTVPDTFDMCPGTPTGTPVDETGCAEAAAVVGDGDGDGVPDDKDLCPSTVPGVKVDDVGCQIIEESIVLRGITFRTGSSRIQPASYPVLDNVIEVLKAHPEIKIEIQGHTDSTGSLRTNMRLSEARARAVYNYLVKAGIAKDRMSYKGYGPDQPIASNDTPEGREQNRRIEFKIVEK